MKFATKSIRQCPSHFSHVATLPREIKKSNFLLIFSRRVRECKQIAFSIASNQSINHILFPSQEPNKVIYSPITYRVIEMVGCQKSKCSSSWPPITTFTCIVNMQTFIPEFIQTHIKPTIQTISSDILVVTTASPATAAGDSRVHCTRPVAAKQPGLEPGRLPCLRSHAGTSLQDCNA